MQCICICVAINMFCLKYMPIVVAAAVSLFPPRNKAQS